MPILFLLMMAIAPFAGNVPALAGESTFSVTGGAAVLAGDLDTSSDAGPSARVAYMYHFSPFIGIGVEGGISRVSGKQWITSPGSPYNGAHDYTTTMIPAGIVLRLGVPLGRIRPFLEGSAGAVYWFPEDVADTQRLPLRKVVNYATDYYGAAGGGIGITLNDHWGLELNGRARFMQTDELDLVDGEFISGSATANDVLVEGGMAIVFRFGGAQHATMPTLSEPAVSVTPHAQQPPVQTVPAPPMMPEPPPTPSPEPARTVAPETMPLPTPPPVMIPGTTWYTVHVASNRNPAYAARDIAMYREAGYDAFAVLTDVPGAGEFNRVYIGRYETRAEARTVADRLLSLGLTEYAAPMELTIPRETMKVLRGYVIHVSSFRTETTARKDAARYERAGYDVLVREVELGEKGRWYRVLIGPYRDRSEADADARIIRGWGFTDETVILPLY